MGFAHTVHAVHSESMAALFQRLQQVHFYNPKDKVLNNTTIPIQDGTASLQHIQD